VRDNPVGNQMSKKCLDASRAVYAVPYVAHNKIHWCDGHLTNVACVYGTTDLQIIEHIHNVTVARYIKWRQVDVV